MAMKIPQVSPWLDDEAAEAVAGVIRDNWITEGPKSKEFSERLNALMGTPYGVFAPNGTLALVLGLLALGVGPGDEVLVPDVTFIGSATAVILAGAAPIWVDVDDREFQIDVRQTKRRVTPHTKAIMPVHLFGTACDMGALNQFARAHDLLVIEDAAQGVGVHWMNQHTGTMGDVGCFSFFADKTITTGEGGYVTCKDPEIHKRLLLLRNQGRLDRGSFIHPAVGYNFRMTDMQCALGLIQLKRLDRIVARKTELLERYRAGLAAVSEVRVLGAAPGANQVPFRCVLMAERAHDLMPHLERSGVQTRSFFYPLHRQPSLREWGEAHGLSRELFEDASFPNAVYGWDHGVCLPIHPTLTDAEVDFVCTSIAQFYGR
jgi:perosamine synthetase